MINKKILPQAYAECIEILKHIPTEDVKKIPEHIIDNMKKEKDENYTYKITHYDDFENQELLDETKALLAVLYRDYWATDYQKEKIKQKEIYDLQIIEEEKREKYNPDDIFKKKNMATEGSNIDLSENNTDNSLIEYKESFFFKLKDFIIKILHIKN